MSGFTILNDRLRERLKTALGRDQPFGRGDRGVDPGARRAGADGWARSRGRESLR